MDRIRQLPDIPSMPRYSVGTVNTAELEAAVHVPPTSAAKDSGKRGNGRGLSATSCSGSSSGASIGPAGGSLSDESTSGAQCYISTQSYVAKGCRISKDVRCSWGVIFMAVSEGGGCVCTNYVRCSTAIGLIPVILLIFFVLVLATHVWLASVHIYVLALAADGGRGTKGRSRRTSVRHGIGVKGGRRGSMAIDKSWEAINKVTAPRPSREADGLSSALGQILITACF